MARHALISPEHPVEEGTRAVPPAPLRAAASHVRRRVASIPLALVLGLGAILAIDAWWLERFRVGYPVQVDEAGYLTMGLVDAGGLRHGGISGLWHAVLSSKLQAPFGPLLTLPFHVIFGWSLADGFALSLVLAVVLAVLTYAIARRLMPRSWSVLAALTVAAAPEVTDNARDFLLALPLAVMFTAAIWALGRSESLVRTGWTVAAGALLGLATVSRTMGLAFVAGPILAAVLQTAVLRPARRRLANLTVLLMTALVVAFPWYVGSISTVLPYLEGHSPYFRGAHHSGSRPAPELWQTALRDLFVHGLFVPLGLGFAACFVIGAVTVIDKWSAKTADQEGPPRVSRTARLRELTAAPGFVPAVSLGEGSLVLLVSHQSVGQWLPLIPVLTVCAIGCAAMARWVTVRRVIAGYLAVLIVLNTVMMSDTVSWLSQRVFVSVPVLGSVPFVDGQGDIQGEVYNAHQPDGTATAPLPARDSEWLPLSRQVAGWVLRLAANGHVTLVVAFSSTDRLFNTNTVQLEGELGFHQDIPMAQLAPNISGDTVAAYHKQLVDPIYGQPNVLISVDPGPGEFKPVVNQRFAQQAARFAGFVLVRRFRLPDGRQGRIWWRSR